MPVTTIDYVPQPKQALMHYTEATEVLFGGSAGGGKSIAMRMDALMWCLTIPGIQVYLFRRTFPELEKTHIIASREEFPDIVGKYREQLRRWEFNNGAMLHFCHCQYENDVFNYQGAEIHILYVDELTTMTEFIYDYLRARVRCTLKIPKEYKKRIPRIVCASNPGGIGHVFCRQRWVDYMQPLEIKRAPEKEGGMLRQFIPSKLQDNIILMERDPGYISRLDALPEPYRTAYKDGDWNIFFGQAFNFSREHHVVPPLETLPENYPLYMTFDWGFGKPFSIGWWCVDNDDRLIRFDEWYGWNGTPDTGLRLTDSQIAEGIIERELKLGIAGKDVTRIAGNDCFSKKPDYKGGGQGKSTSEVFADYGLYLTPGDPDRKLKFRQFRERLRVKEGETPMLVVTSNCEAFIRTIPLMQTDPQNPEEIDKRGEDHCLHGDTLVKTDSGIYPIKELAGKDFKVQTPSGYAKVDKCWLTRKNTEVVEIVLEDNTAIICTPDHKFLSSSGKWVMAQNLTDEDNCVSMVENQRRLPCKLQLSTKQRKSLMESGIGSRVFIMAGMITKSIQDCIGQYGNITTVKSRKEDVYTIKTIIETITKLKILQCSNLNSIVPIMQNYMLARHLLMLTWLQINGMEVKKEYNGTKSNIKSIVAKHYIKHLVKYVNFVEKNLLDSANLNIVLHLAVTNILQDTVISKWLKKYVPYVEKNIQVSMDLTKHAPKNVVLYRAKQKEGRIKTVNLLPTKHDVYCLNIPHPHAFYLANGVISHNCCDETCLLCLFRAVGASATPKETNLTDKLIDRIERPVHTPADAYEVYAAHEQAMDMMFWDKFVDGGDFDGIFVDTV